MNLMHTSERGIIEWLDKRGMVTREFLEIIMDQLTKNYQYILRDKLFDVTLTLNKKYEHLIPGYKEVFTSDVGINAVEHDDLLSDDEDEDEDVETYPETEEIEESDDN